MKRSTGTGILTTHVGSLPRPPDLLEMIQAKERGEPLDAEAFAARVKSAVAEVVRKQAGIDIVADGEMGRFGFIPYVNERLDRHRAAPDRRARRHLGAIAGISGVPRILRMGGADAGRRRRTPRDPMGVHRPDRLQGAGGAAARHRQFEGRPRRSEPRGSLHAGGVAGQSRQLEHATNITRPTKNSASRWPTRCTRNTRRSSMPASSCRSTTRSWRAIARCTPRSTSRECRKWASATVELLNHALARHPGRAGPLSHLLQHQYRARACTTWN